MVKGLRSPEPMQLDLMRTYTASGAQTLLEAALPASVPFLFASLKVAIAISLVGAIVGELPTGAQAGLGARLLTGSYYGQTIQIWAALFAGRPPGGLALVARQWRLAERLAAEAHGSAAMTPPAPLAVARRRRWRSPSLARSAGRDAAMPGVGASAAVPGVATLVGLGWRPGGSTAWLASCRLSTRQRLAGATSLSLAAVRAWRCSPVGDRLRRLAACPPCCCRRRSAIARQASRPRGATLGRISCRPSLKSVLRGLGHRLRLGFVVALLTDRMPVPAARPAAAGQPRSSACRSSASRRSW